ncbi:MAG: BCCT family transporter [Opitutales bacterium]
MADSKGNPNAPAEAGADPKESFWRVDVHPVVFPVSAGFILLMVVLTLFFQDSIGAVFGNVQAGISHYAGWFFVGAINVILVFVLYLLFSKYGDIRLGGHDAKPEFSQLGWIAMLFSAGMGIGLLFYGVAEPITHFANPPLDVEAGGPEAARVAMDITFLHWGFHPWAIYTLVGLSLAFFAFNRGLPLSIRSVFYPLFGERIHGSLGNVVDILATVATLFGVATSLGLGVQQVNAGLEFLVGWESSPTNQVILITGITALATWSVVRGLDGGIRFLSEINLYVAGALVLFLLLLGPTIFILNGFIENIGYYLQNLPSLATWNETYEKTAWQDGWTVFYWAWWIAWSPFVGMFIARVSYGRTVKEFILAVLFIPTTVTFLWLTVFGNTALALELSGVGGIVEAVDSSIDTALFVLFEQFPLATLTSALGVASIIMFFVTSSDSGSMVIDIITAGGDPDPPVPQRLFWAILEGVVAAVLLLGGGLVALQAAAIVTGLPFAIVLLLMCFSLRKGFADYKFAPGGFRLPPYQHGRSLKTPLNFPTPITSGAKELWLRVAPPSAKKKTRGKS